MLLEEAAGEGVSASKLKEIQAADRGVGFACALVEVCGGLSVF